MEGINNNITHGPVTIGARLDAFVNWLDSLPSTHSYALAVLTSTAIAFLILNTNDPQVRDLETIESLTKQKRRTVVRNASERRSDQDQDDHGSSSSSSSSSSSVPQPKWYILKTLNFVTTIGFFVSVMAFAENASVYIADSYSVIKFLTVWSFFLAYFFGFFGISFVDDEEIKKRSRTVVSSPPRVKKVDTKVVFDAKSKNVEARKKVHPPAASAHPVCGTSDNDASPKKKSLATATTTAGSTSTTDLESLTDEEIASLVVTNRVKDHTLEKLFDPFRAVEIRRLAFDAKLRNLGRGGALADLPSGPSLDYGRVLGANCEIVVGYVPIPVGMVGPLTLNGETVYVPMATTEGCLVASTNRGCKAITAGSGATSTIVNDGITRAPCLRFGSAREAAEAALWCREPVNVTTLKEAFESTTSFGKLIDAKPTVAGRNLYLRLKCFSGDAMGMNMVSKGSLAVVGTLRTVFPDFTLVALSGNMCTDKKAAATNWIDGRGKSVVVEATIPKDVVRKVLKTDVPTIVSTNLQKNLVGSAMAGALGGFNAHAANNVTAIFLATGQDPAQNVESSNCLTMLEETDDGDLWISCTMPSVEVGTVGGGTGLPAQKACLQAIGCQGGGETPGANARRLAHVVAAGTMAGELSLLAALAANTLVSAHMQHNRKQK